jgi:CRISPR-associated protein Cmr1
MPKEIPECPQKPNPVLEAVHHYEIELVTPMFGGGIEPRVNDSMFPIRPTAIRGQLQFWWRATVGARYETLKKLRDAQTEVWGSTERASRVQVRVENVRISEPIPCAHYEYRPPKGEKRARHDLIWNEPFSTPEQRHWGTEYLPKDVTYALFPFQGEKAKRIQPGCIPEVVPASAIHQARFRLTLTCDLPVDFARDVEPAIWAWVNFGGLGGRTRRGCGAIVCKTLAPRDKDDLKAMWLRYMPTVFPHREWPTLTAAILVGVEKPDSISAWDHVIGRFKHFRQGVELGRNGDNPKFPKRSRWPEPEAVRMTTEQRLPKHGVLNTSNEVAFPRAEFGLPIVFHFKDEDKWNPTNPDADPEQTVLYPSAGADGKKRERMASPLILKPLALQNGKAVPLILRLRTPDLEGVDLRRAETSLNLPTTTAIRDPHLSSYPNSPLAESPNGSAIEAFLAFSRAEGFTEVTR